MSHYCCHHCAYNGDNINKVLDHISDNHKIEEISLREKRLCDKTGRFYYQTLRYNTTIYSSGEKRRLQYENGRVRVVSDEPSAKLKKPNVFPESPEYENETVDLNDCLKQATEKLERHGYLKDIHLFLRLVSEDRFPFHNIAFQLFVDVVRWFSCDTSTNMRYSDTVKSFWRTGIRLFKGKFHRFMSGTKNQGQTEPAGEFDTSKSDINFAVPDRKLLSTSYSLSECGKPGVLHSVLDTLAADEEHQQKAYKIAVDLKKLNYGGKNGDIDCFGLEGSPTLQERQIRLSTETQVIDFASDVLHEQSKSLNSVRNIKSQECDKLNKSILDLVKVGAGRLKDLKELRVKRQLGFERFHKDAGTDWKKSKHAFVLSSIQISLYNLNDIISNLLSTTDTLLNVGSCINRTSDLFSSENIKLGHQENFICLNDVNQNVFTNSSVTLQHYSPFVKQRTPLWFDIRSKAKVTGSTAFSALGLRTLKEQKDHFEQVFNKKEKPPVSDKLRPILQHGIDNEKNAVATIVAKIMPLMYPQCSFHEEGCYILKHEGEVFAVVSPDGSIRKGQEKLCAVEIKCPIPGKTYSTDVFYKPPGYYVPQMLLEMKSMNVKELLMVCYTPETTTAFHLKFDEGLWNKIWVHLTSLYGVTLPSKPKNKHPFTAILKDSIARYIDSHSELIAEVKSIQGSECSHDHGPDGPVSSTETHTKPVDTESIDSMTIDECQQILHRYRSDITRAYELSRQYAKQVLVVMISDLDRLYKKEIPHAAPCAYALTGYSVTTDLMSKILAKVKLECRKRGLHVIAECFDGAFARIALRSSNNKPLTRLQLLKDVWNEARKTPKQIQVKQLTDHGRIEVDGSYEELSKQTEMKVLKKCDESGNLVTTISIRPIVNMPTTPINALRYLKNDIENDVQHSNSLDSVPVGALAVDDDIIFDSVLPSAEHYDCLLPTDNEEPPNEREQSGTQMLEDDSHDDQDDSDEDIPLDDSRFLGELSAALDDLKRDAKRQDRWKKMNASQFQKMFVNAESINRHLQKNELIVVAGHLGISGTAKTKQSLVNEIASKFGFRGTFTSRRRHSPKCLRNLSIAALRKMNKAALNIVYASFIFPDRLSTWNAEAIVPNNVKVKNTYIPEFWYAQPCIDESTQNVLFNFLDPEHILVNARCKVCSSGMPKAGIMQKAWKQVAKEQAHNNCGLNYALVEELLDKQSCAYAKKTFSEEVQQAMVDRGFHNEAIFCERIRHWYEAQDEPGLSAIVRNQYDMQMRDWLLKQIKLEEFPPPGSHVNDIPVSMFEGILMHIDRRMQLYSYVPKGTYNVRSIGTLDCENFFGAFQDWDPRGSGILKPSEVPRAIEVASELFHTRMNSARGFVMKTSANRVYPEKQLLQIEEPGPDSKTEECEETHLCVTNPIELRDHEFDKPWRKKAKPKRKSGTINPLNAPAKGAKGLRAEHYHVNEAKLLPHVRAGICLPDLQ